MFLQKSNISKEDLAETYKQVSKQSERQIGGFLFLHLIVFGKSYSLNKKIPELRNKVIHQGYIPMPQEVIELGELIYQEIFNITKLISSDLADEMQKVIMDTMQIRNKKIPIGMPRATTTGTIFFSLVTANKKESFQEAFSNYKKVREMLSQTEPLLRVLSKELVQPSE